MKFIELKVKHLDVIMREMFKRVGAKYDLSECNSPHWYEKHTWTEEEQDSFMGWMVDYLHGSLEARRELMHCPHQAKRELRKFVGMFILAYGWKCNYKKSNK